MAEQIPENLMKLVERGGEKVRKFREQQEEEWNDIVDTHKKRWQEIENSVKKLLPLEVKDFFTISINAEIPSVEEFERGGYMKFIKTEDIENMRSLIPDVSVIGKEGKLKIPGFEIIHVSIEDKFGYPHISYWGGGVEPDGSLEVALYCAKARYDSDTRAKPSKY